MFVEGETRPVKPVKEKKKKVNSKSMKRPYAETGLDVRNMDSSTTPPFLPTVRTPGGGSWPRADEFANIGQRSVSEAPTIRQGQRTEQGNSSISCFPARLAHVRSTPLLSIVKLLTTFGLLTLCFVQSRLQPTAPKLKLLFKHPP